MHMYYTGPLQPLLAADKLINNNTNKLGLFNSLLNMLTVVSLLTNVSLKSMRTPELDEQGY